MGKMRRIWIVLRSLIIILCGILIMENPEEGYFIAILVLDITLLVKGFGKLFYYLTLARYMVGGIKTLYSSLIVIDFGLFVLGLSVMPQRAVMIYLMAVLGFKAAQNIISAFQARSLKSPHWKLSLITGIICLTGIVICAFHMDSTRLAGYVFGVTIIYSAIADMIMALRRTAIVYVES